MRKRNKAISTSKEYNTLRGRGAKNKIENENLESSDRRQKLGFCLVEVTQ